MATRILVVDDSPTIRTVVSTILERSGFDPKVASDGQDAYEALSSGEVTADLVLIDFVMPRMNGFQLCRALRDNPALSSMPVILMSAKGDRIRDQFVQQTGALDAITKPFDAQALVAVIENALRKVNTKRASSARLPDFDSDDVTGVGTQSLAALEYETRRTHITQIIGQKLAAIAARTVAERPDLVEVSRLATELSERLSNEAILEMLEAIRDFGRSDKGGPVLAGDLAVVPIGAILQLLQGEKQSGVLVCTSGDLEVRTTFRAGAIDLVEASGLSHEFRLGRFFVEEGVVTPAEIDEILKPGGRLLGKVPVVEGNVRIDAAERLGGDEAEAPYSTVQMKEKQTTSSVGARGLGELPDVELVAELVATPKRRPLGMALLAAGKIVPLQLKTALTRQSSELLYEVLRWPSGRFELRREPPSELAEGAKLGLPVASVVMEGFRRVDEWRVLERTIGSFDAVLVRDDSAFGKLDVTSLPLKEKAVLDAVDGERTVREIVMESHLSSFDACRILVQLLEARALRRRAG